MKNKSIGITAMIRKLKNTLILLRMTRKALPWTSSETDWAIRNVIAMTRSNLRYYIRQRKALAKAAMKNE